MGPHTGCRLATVYGDEDLTLLSLLLKELYRRVGTPYLGSFPHFKFSFLRLSKSLLREVTNGKGTLIMMRLSINRWIRVHHQLDHVSHGGLLIW